MAFVKALSGMKTCFYLIFLSLALSLAIPSDARLSVNIDETKDAAHGMGFDLPQTANVFGAADRDLITPENIVGHRVRNKIGKLIDPLGLGCTASLIWKNLILSAAHCVYDEDNPGELLKGEYRFCIGHDEDGNCEAESSVNHFWWGTLDADSGGRQNDWVILRLDEPLGDRFGYFGWRTPDSWEDNVNLAGFGGFFFGGNRLNINTNCRLRGSFRDDKLFLHDCDTSRGDSGSPVFTCNDDDCRIVALHVAAYRNGEDSSLVVDEYSQDVANIAISPKQFGEKIRELRESNP